MLDFIIERTGIPDGFYVVLPFSKKGPFDEFDLAAQEAGVNRRRFLGKFSPAVLQYENDNCIGRWEWLDGEWTKICL